MTPYTALLLSVETPMSGRRLGCLASAMAAAAELSSLAWPLRMSLYPRTTTCMPSAGGTMSRDNAGSTPRKALLGEPALSRRFAASLKPSVASDSSTCLHQHPSH